MNWITAIPEGKALMNSRGVFRQVDLYERTDTATGNRRVYAKHGAGFVRLNAGGSTSLTSLRWIETDAPDGQIIERANEVIWEPAKAAVAAE